MKKNFLILSLLGLALTTSLVSCSRDDDFGTEVTQKSNLNMTFTADDVVTYSNLEIEILEVNTGSLIKKSISNLNTLQLMVSNAIDKHHKTPAIAAAIYLAECQRERELEQGRLLDR